MGARLNLPCSSVWQCTRVVRILAESVSKTEEEERRERERGGGGREEEEEGDSLESLALAVRQNLVLIDKTVKRSSRAPFFGLIKLEMLYITDPAAAQVFFVFNYYGKWKMSQ